MSVSVSTAVRDGKNSRICLVASAAQPNTKKRGIRWSGETRHIEIGMGPLRQPLAEQLRDQGLLCDESECELWEGHRLAISRLAIHGLLTDAESRAANKRLFKRIQKSVAQSLGGTGSHSGGLAR